MSIKISAIVVDDERPAREEILYLLRNHTDINVVGVCKNAMEAKDMIEALKPDVVFLDISMPRMDGFTLLQQLIFVPYVIFVTAFDAYALKAIEENALDYLLKPVQPARLSKALDRLRHQLKHHQQYRNLFLRDGNSYHMVNVGEIFLVESFGNYVKIFFKDKKVLQPTTLKEMMAVLDENVFFQINRHQVINLNHVQRLMVLDSRQCEVHMLPGLTLTCASRRAVALKTKVNLHR